MKEQKVKIPHIKTENSPEKDKILHDTGEYLMKGEIDKINEVKQLLESDKPHKVKLNEACKILETMVERLKKHRSTLIQHENDLTPSNCQ